MIGDLSSANPQARAAAYDALARSYWQPVYAYIRIRRRKSTEDAQDLTQEFFTRAFEREYLESMLRQSNGNIAAAARYSNKPRRVFFELMRKHGLRGSDYAPTLSVARGTTGKD